MTCSAGAARGRRGRGTDLQRSVFGTRATATRPGWSDLEVRLRRDDELVVWRIDRIGRSMIDVITTVDELLERGIRVRSLHRRDRPLHPSGTAHAAPDGHLRRIRKRTHP